MVIYPTSSPKEKKKENKNNMCFLLYFNEKKNKLNKLKEIVTITVSCINHKLSWGIPK